MTVAHHLRQRLDALQPRGRITGEMVLVPMANPVGVGQWLPLADKLGRPPRRFAASPRGMPLRPRGVGCARAVRALRLKPVASAFALHPA